MLSVRLDSTVNPPWGVAGGMGGGPGRVLVNPGTNRARELAPLSDGNMLQMGDILRIETGGGGGHGHPFDREPEAVLADVRAGFVSVEAAAAEYGVVIRDGALDQAATAAARNRRGPEKMFHRTAYEDVLG
jgi:N-methylhydantoinase B